jgi:hypothetical protein
LVIVINGNLPHAYLGSNIVYIPQQVISIVLLVKGNSGQSLFIIYSTPYTDKEILRKRSSFVYYIPEDVLSSLYVQTYLSVSSVD